MTEPRPADDLRAELLHALDFAYCSGVGYETPEQMLDAYDTARDAERPAPTSPTAVLREAADHLARQADELWAPGRTAHTVMHADAIELRRLAAEAERGQRPTTATSAPTSPAAVLRDAADRLDRLGLRDLATRELRRMADEAETGGAR